MHALAAGRPPLAAVAGGIGAVLFLAAGPGALGLPVPVRGALIAIPLALLGCGLLRAADGATGRAWSPLAALALLPAAHLLPGGWPAPGAAALSAVALGLAAWRRRDVDAFPLTSRPGGLWRAGLLALSLALACVYLVIGFRAQGNQRPDAAYYLGVARHIATTDKFEEPLVWHFLDPPPQLAHAPFDYWAPGTSLALVPALRVFGESDRVALTTMASIAALSVVLFGLLVARSRRLRYAPLQLLALLLFALSPAAASYRFDTESIPLFHLVLVAALLAFDRGRWVAAIAIASLLVWCRSGAGSVFCALIWAACVACILRDEPGRRGARLRWAAIAAAVGIAAWVGFNLLLFGSPLPPAARLGPFLADPLDLLRVGVVPVPSAAALLSRLAPAELWDAAARTAHALFATDLVPFRRLWLALAALPLLGLLRGGIESDGLASLMLFAGAFATVLLSGAVYSDRTPLELLPLLVFAGACGAGQALRRAREALARRASPAAIAAGAAIVLVGCGALYARRLEVYGERGPAWLGTPSLARLAGTLGDGVVASELPYFVLAEIGQPAVTLPLDGEAAVEAVLERYDVAWLVLFGTDFASPDLPTERLVQEILAGTRTRLGAFRVTHVRTQPGEWTLYRLARIAPQAAG